MSTADPRLQTRTDGTYAGGAYADEREAPGYGWVLFAGTLLMILGVVNLIDGIAAVSNSTFFVGDAKLVASDLNTWGWILVVMGGIQLLLALGIWAQMRGLRWFGVGIAALNAVAQLIVMPAYPFWALCLFTLDILVIYGLIAHGARQR